VFMSNYTVMKTKTYAGFRPITSNIALYTAMIDRAAVLVFQDGELIGSGRIDKITERVTFDDITEDIVEIRGERFIRGACTFVYAKGE